MYTSVFLYIDSEMSVSHFTYIDKNCMKGKAMFYLSVKRRQQKGKNKRTYERKPQILVIK